MVAIAPARTAPRVTSPAPRRFSVAEYERMVRARILHEDERVELLEGAIIQMAPIGSRHMACVNRLAKFFMVGCGDRAIVSIQNAFHLSVNSMPQPDLALFRPHPRFYEDALPEPGDVLLIIEVSDTTLRFDRGVKLPLYAAAGIPEVWIVDLPRKRLLVHRLPEGSSYRQETIVPRNGAIAPAAFPELPLRLADLFG